jgi:hypothetical protein
MDTTHRGALGRALDAHARIALHLSGGHHTHAARYVPMRGGGRDGMVAFAGWDGRIHLQAGILANVRELFDGGSARRAPAQLRDVAESLHTCLHEHAHMIVPAGRTFAENALAYATWPVYVIEEGTTEAWTQDQLPRFLRSHEHLAPGLAALTTDTRSYAPFVPAVRELARHLGGRLGVADGEVIGTLNRRGPASKLALLAYLGLRAGDAWERMPAAHRQRSVFTVAGVVAKEVDRHRRWASLDAHGVARTPDALGRSAIMGMRAMAAIDRTVRELRHRHVERDRDWHRASLEYEVALARRARGMSRGRHPTTGRAAADWYAEAKSRLQRARTRSLQAPAVLGSER